MRVVGGGGALLFGEKRRVPHFISPRTGMTNMRRRRYCSTVSDGFHRFTLWKRSLDEDDPLEKMFRRFGTLAFCCHRTVAVVWWLA
jgi:hypothetical protein